MKEDKTNKHLSYVQRRHDKKNQRPVNYIESVIYRNKQQPVDANTQLCISGWWWKVYMYLVLVMFSTGHEDKMEKQYVEIISANIYTTLTNVQFV